MTAPQRGGPPKEVAAPLPSKAATATNITERAQSSEYVAAMKHRRAAARRLAILDPGRGADPWHYDEVLLTPHQADAWRQTVEHLAELGCLPIISTENARGLWRCGGASRELLERVEVASR